MIGQGAFILGCSGPVLSPSEKTFFRDANPFGFILFGRNLKSIRQARQLTDDLRAAVGWNAPVLIDQEGGRVERMRSPHWREWLPPLEQMKKAGPRALALRYQIIAMELSAAGIDVNCAPVCDIARPDTHPFLQNRCYGTTAEVVTEAARAVCDGLLAGGVLPVLKHMPGHGAAQVDTHKELQSVDHALEDLQAMDFKPFKALTDTALAMTAHLIFPAVDAERPATQSPKMIDVMRRDIGFDGMLMSDDISMEALSGTVAERGRLALNAGCDVVLHCNGKMDEMETIADLGQMSDAAMARAGLAIGARDTTQTAARAAPVDISALEEEFLALVPGGFHV